VWLWAQWMVVVLALAVAAVGGPVSHASWLVCCSQYNILLISSYYSLLIYW